MRFKDTLKATRLAAILAFATPASAGDYKIKSGETFYSISREYGIPLQKIIDANPDVEPKKLQIGQSIYIPDGITNAQNIKESYYNSEPGLNIMWEPTPNYKQGRLKDIEGIVIHSTEGSGNGAVSWLKNPKSNASAHYVIKEDGTIVQMVKDGDTAWHVGRKGNSSYIGIEFAGYAHKPGFKFNEKQYESGGKLVSQLMKEYGITNVVGHDWVTKNLGGTTHTDPGKNFDWDKFRSYINSSK